MTLAVKTEERATDLLLSKSCTSINRNTQICKCGEASGFVGKRNNQLLFVKFCESCGDDSAFEIDVIMTI